ncbi:hypothetical protein GCM10022243_00250 [Saccharothrix violaceirubra]
MNTPVCPPASVPGTIRASSSASHANSSTSRCCGSIVAASRGDIPKNPASNPETSSRKPPGRTPARPSGGAVIASRPSRNNRQNAAGSGACGNRQDIPTIATDSSPEDFARPIEPTPAHEKSRPFPDEINADNTDRSVKKYVPLDPE